MKTTFSKYGIQLDIIYIDDTVTVEYRHTNPNTKQETYFSMRCTRGNIKYINDKLIDMISLKFEDLDEIEYHLFNTYNEEQHMEAFKWFVKDVASYYSDIKEREKNKRYIY